MSKFTEGKWEITKHLDITCNDVYVALVCHEDHRELFSPQSRANARLIAAAPEMYCLLGIAVPALLNGNTELQFSVANKIKALLARIDGEEVKHA